MRVTLYLLRDGVAAEKSALRRPDDYHQVAVVDPSDAATSWQLFVRQAPTAPVGWLGTLSGITADGATVKLTGASAGAVLLIATGGRTFAVTFGTGFHAIDSSVIEPDFGLRVAANSVDPKKITQAEARGLGRDARNAVSSVPVPNEMYALRLVTDEEWIRRFAGHSVDKTFALTLSGADSLRMTIDGEDLQALPKTLRRALKRFSGTKYKKNFPYFDNFRRLAASDPRVAALEAALDVKLRTRPADVGFAVPDEMNFAQIDYFVVRASRNTVQIDDLAPDKVYDAIDAVNGWTDPLKRVRIVAVSDRWEPSPEKSLGAYVVADVNLPSAGGQPGRYVITAGAWFKVADDYARELDAKIRAIPDETATVGLPDWDSEWLKHHVKGKYAEERYNRHAAKQLGHDLLDRKLYRGKAGERVEIADLLSAAKQLICVKRLDGSATMVHLFEQGSLSASLLGRSQDYQMAVMKRLETLSVGSVYGSPGDWTVVFGIATSKPGPIHDALPFFARASLAANAQDIRDRGYKVALARIEMTD